MEEKNVKALNIQQSEKPSYEQLEREVVGLKGMNNQLMMQLQQINMGNLFKRLDYCFKVLELSSSVSSDILSTDFIKRCAKEIEELMTPTEESDTKE